MRVQALSKRYDGKAVVDSVSFSIPKGKVTSLIGPNGAGKSTVMGMISRLIAKDAGLIDFEDRDIAKWKSRELAKKLAILTQHNNVQMKLTVRELVAFGRFPYSGNHLTKEDQRIVDQAVAYMELKEFEDRFIDELSGGQRQRIGIARRIRYRQHEIPLGIRHRSDIFPFDADTDVGHGRTIRRIEYATAQQVLRTCGGKATRQHGNTNANSHTVSGLHRERYGMRIYCESERIFTSVAFRGRIR